MLEQECQQQQLAHLIGEMRSDRQREEHGEQGDDVQTWPLAGAARPFIPRAVMGLIFSAFPARVALWIHRPRAVWPWMVVPRPVVRPDVADAIGPVRHLVMGPEAHLNAGRARVRLLFVSLKRNLLDSA